MVHERQTGNGGGWWRRQLEAYQTRGRHERAALRLYRAIVTAARSPDFYAVHGVPDTMDGRFEMIGLHAALVLRRLRDGGAEAEAIAQQLFDLMFADMDRNLREAGVGDLSIGRHVKGLASTFLARVQSLDGAITARDGDAVAAIVRHNLRTPRNEDVRADVDAIARHLLALDRDLALHPLADLLTDEGELALWRESR